MKRHLPRPFGFTLIELLVVISIIAILVAISVSVFSAAQQSARDGKRLSQLSSLAKSIESSRDYTTPPQKYGYSNADFLNDFPKGIDDALGYDYCVTSVTTPGTPAVTLAPTLVQITGCPANWQPAISGIPNSGSATSWSACVKLERRTAPACQTSLSK